MTFLTLLRVAPRGYEDARSEGMHANVWRLYSRGVGPSSR